MPLDHSTSLKRTYESTKMKHLRIISDTKGKLLFAAIALAGLLLALSPTLAQADDASSTTGFSYAVELYKSGKVSAAFGRFRLLANAGNLEAAKIALFMLRNSEVLYGTAWSATPSEIARWLVLTSDQTGLADVGSKD